MRTVPAGFSLVEVLVSLFLMFLLMLAIAPVFVQATRSTASAGEMGSVGALAVQRMELLRQVPFDTLAAGGSLSSNQAGHFDASDPDYTVRWRITDDAAPATLKTIEVWVAAINAPVGLPKQITLTTMEAVQ